MEINAAGASTSECALPSPLIKAHVNAISSCNFVDEDKIITSSFDCSVKLWEIHTGSKLSEFNHHVNCVSACSFDKEDRKVLSGSWDRHIIFWDLESSTPIWRGRHSSLVTSCDLHPASHLGMSGCDSGKWGYWDLRSGVLVKKLEKSEGHLDTVTSCKFSHDGLSVCTTSMDSTTRVWDVRTNRCLLILRDHSNAVTSCTFSSKDSYLATASWDRTIHLYDIQIGSFRSTGPTVLKYHEGCVSACCFSPDDSLLASCGCDKIVSTWNTVSNKLQSTLKGHTSWIYCCQFSGSGDWISSGSKGGELRLWRTKVPDRKYTKDRLPFEQPKCYECGLIDIPDISEDHHSDKMERCTRCKMEDKQVLIQTKVTN